MRRREFLKAGAAGTLGVAGLRAGGPAPRGHLLVFEEGSDRTHAFSLETGRRSFTYRGLNATHAIQLVPGKQRAFVHGLRTDRHRGGVAVLDLAGPVPKLETELDTGWYPLHWQPRHDLGEIAYNTISDRSLLVLDTDTLELEPFPRAGGDHSLMAFHGRDLVASNGLVDDGVVLVTDRQKRRVDFEVPVGPWPHGLTVSYERERAYCWCSDGVHVIGLAGKERGAHLGVLRPFRRGQRCWFAWAPQGGRYNYDVSWDRGDVYHPYLTAVDARENRLEKIPSGRRRPGTLTVSDDGELGLASSRNTQEALLFDLSAQRFLAAIPVGPSDPSAFFDRDLSLAPGGRWAAVTNPPEASVSLLDLEARRELRRIHLGFQPGWMKMHVFA